MITNFDQLLETAQSLGPITVAVAAAEDDAALSALREAGKIGLAHGLLYGREEKIVETLCGEIPDYLTIEDEPDPLAAAQKAIAAVREGKAEVVLKGRIKTAELLRVVLDKTAGLRTGRLLSDVFLCEDPRRTGNKLIFITDGGVILAPDINQKIDIIHNAVDVAHALGNDCPKVALLSAVETVVPDLPSTAEAAIITKMNQRGQIRGCIVDGPLALDNAVSPEAAEIKGIDSPVAGYADILVCPGIEAANMLAKSTTYFAGLRLAHVIMGSSAPVLIPSRSDSADAKLLSVAMGALVCRRAK